MLAKGDDQGVCSLCGETLQEDESGVELLCADCVDAWTREVEVEW